nr:nascent polypeptide-associated complex subunit alpha, muscle-specific form-like [Equus asinus]
MAGRDRGARRGRRGRRRAARLGARGGGRRRRRGRGPPEEEEERGGGRPRHRPGPRGQAGWGRGGRRPSRPGPGAAGGAAGRAALALRGGLRSARGPRRRRRRRHQQRQPPAGKGAAAAAAERPPPARGRPGSQRPLQRGGTDRVAPAPPTAARPPRPRQSPHPQSGRPRSPKGLPPCPHRLLLYSFTHVYPFRTVLQTPAPSPLPCSHPEFTHPTSHSDPILTLLSPKLFPSSASPRTRSYHAESPHLKISPSLPETTPLLQWTLSSHPETPQPQDFPALCIQSPLHKPFPLPSPRPAPSRPGCSL